MKKKKKSQHFSPDKFASAGPDDIVVVNYSESSDSMDGDRLGKMIAAAKQRRAERPRVPATKNQREEFASLLRFALDVVGAPPRGYEDDEHSAMEMEAANYERRKRKAKRKLEDIIDALREMASRYPELEEKYKQDLDRLP